MFLISLDFQNIIKKLDIYMKLINIKKMNKKFVLESFQAYLDIELNQLNEAKGPSEITPESVVGLVQKMLEKQKEKGKADIKLKKFASEKDPYAALKASPEFKSLGFKYSSAFAAPYLFDKLTDEQKNDLYKGISESLNRNGFKKIQEVEKLIEKKANITVPPVIYILGEENKISKTEENPGSRDKREFQLISEEDENGIFKDNEWDLKDSSFSSPEMKEKLVNPIKEIVSNFAAGKIEIEFIEIETSANRYRNTGISENLSWGELSSNRANTIALIFKAAVEEYQLTEEQKNVLQSKITLDYGGSNRDGTSGPNPVDPIPFGYYDENSKFIRNNGSYDKKRSTVVIDKIGNDGKPSGEIEIKTIEPDSDKSQYEKYKYVNIVIKASEPIIIPYETLPDEPINQNEEVKYIPLFKIPSKYESGSSIRIKPRRRRTGTRGKGTGKRICIEF